MATNVKAGQRDGKIDNTSLGVPAMALTGIL